MSGHAVRLVLVVAGAFLLAACGAEGGDDLVYEAPQPAVVALVDGAGVASGLPLTARFEAYVESDRELRLRIHNTSPDSSSAVDDAPLLTAVGFNLAGNVPLECLEIAGADSGRDSGSGSGNGSENDSALLGLTGGEEAFCQRLVERGAIEDPFLISLASGDWTAGVARVEQRDVWIRIAEGCPVEFAFTKEALLEAPRSRAADGAGQWIATFTQVGIDGADTGCAIGDGGPAPLRKPIREIWSSFIATTAEAEPSDSDRQPDDTRAGSIDVRFTSGVDRVGRPLPPKIPVAIAAIRNGAGDILEQWHLNDRFPPQSVGADDCDTATDYPRCYLYSENERGLAIDLPQTVAHSNVGFDEDGSRVAVRGVVELVESGDGALRRLLRVRWERPISIARARLNLRVRSDGNLDGSSDDDPFVTLYRARWPGSGGDFVAPPVRVVEQTETSVTIEVDVAAAEAYVFDAYAGR